MSSTESSLREDPLQLCIDIMQSHSNSNIIFHNYNIPILVLYGEHIKSQMAVHVIKLKMFTIKVKSDHKSNTISIIYQLDQARFRPEEQMVGVPVWLRYTLAKFIDMYIISKLKLHKMSLLYQIIYSVVIYRMIHYKHV